jgi:tetratricopeptide (TPR) repeat protein/DNA-binding XRE family transcriptional regulator
MAEPSLTFAALLRKLRTEAGLTQEELAAAADLSVRSVSDLERGINLTARRDTARLLARALNLADPARETFEAIARGRMPADSFPGGSVPSGGLPSALSTGGAAAIRTLPHDTASFIGREPELRRLLTAAANTAEVVGIHAIGGMAGVGKTALAIHAAHRLADQFPDGQVFLPLHGHTPGQRPVSPADALASMLLTVGVPAAQIPSALEARAALWRDHLAGKRLLLLLDDAVNSEQVWPLLPGSGGNLVLVTSRRHLTALDDAEAISLDILSLDESVGLLIRLAARPELTPGDAALADIARLCGYLPLAIGLLARQLHHHPAWTPADLAADLSAARDRLELMSAESLSVAAAFDLSYQDLIADQQRLFRRLGLHPGTDIDVYAVAALGGVELAAARRRLAALYDHYLLTEPVRGRYRLHDLIREHARALAATDPAEEREAALGRLLDYYLATAQLADRHLALRSAGAPAPALAPPAHVPDLGTSERALAWMNAERLNLRAIFGYAATSGQPGYATAIAAAMNGFLRKGHWTDALTLHHAAAELAREADEPHAEADALTDLAHIQDLTADFAAASANLVRAVEIYRRIGYKTGEARALSELGTVRRLTGRYPEAAADLTLALELFRDSHDQLGEADALFELGSVQHRTGDLKASMANQTAALDIYRDIGYQRGEAWTLNSLGVTQYDAGDYAAAMVSLGQALELQRLAGNRLGEANTTYEIGVVHRLTGDYPGAVTTQFHALEMYRELGYQRGEANVRTEIGTVRRLTGDYPAAIACHQQALELYRTVSDKFGEGVIFRELGAVQYLTRDFRDASVSLARALRIFHDLGDQANIAEVLNYMGELALVSAKADDARDHFEKALTIAATIAIQPEEARALEGIGRCHLQNGHTTQAADFLRSALVIYQRIGSLTAAHRVQEILHDRRFSGSR